MITDVGMNGIREIDRSGAARQGQNLALRREHVHGIGEKVDLYMLEKLAGVACLALDIEQGLQPLMGTF